MHLNTHCQLLVLFFWGGAGVREGGRVGGVGRYLGGGSQLEEVSVLGIGQGL